jgi:hypothetical protein
VAFHRHKESFPSFARTYFPLFGKYGVDLVLFAHHHAYDRSYPVRYTTKDFANPMITDNNTSNYINTEGQIYVKVGTGGAFIHLPIKRPFIVNQYAGHGFLNIDVINNGTILNATFYANDGTVKDQFTISKNEQYRKYLQSLPCIHGIIVECLKFITVLFSTNPVTLPYNTPIIS